MKLSRDETANLCRSLSLLLHGGIGLAEGLYLLAETEQETGKALLLSLAGALETGSSLSGAMEAQAVFSADVTGMVRIGEETGRLEEALEALGLYYEEQVRMFRQIRSALTYPCLLLFLLLGVLVILLVKVLPVFDSVYASLGTGMTGVAGGLLILGQGLELVLPGMLVLLAVPVVLILVGALSPRLRQQAGAFLARHLGDRGVFRKFSNARFARAMAMGLGSGLPMEEALSLSAQLLADLPGAADRCSRCAAAAAQGAALSDAMGDAALLTPAQSRLLEAGLRSGNGDRVMAHLADRIMEEAGTELETVVSRVEPALVLGASVLVGTILLAVMLPLADILSVIG